MAVDALNGCWEGVNWFTPVEFPAGVLAKLDMGLIVRLDKFREQLKHRVIPSPLKGGWCRSDGSTRSRHYVGNGRLSDGGDVFPQCDVRQAMLTALSCGLFGGVGVYLDTTGPSGKPEGMLHLDMRPEPLLWMRYEGRYIYPSRSMEEATEFWQRLAEYKP